MRIPVGLILAALCTQSLFALDFNAVYPRTPTQPNGTGFYAGLAEQGTYFNDTQVNGHPPRASNGRLLPLGQQYLTTITSEPFLGYNFCEHFGLQLELPVIYRESVIVGPGSALRAFTQDFRSDFGMGDIRLLGNVGLIHKNGPDYTVNWNFIGGIKLPTGDSSKLSKTDPATTTGITSADLALGSGSYDGVVGTDLHLRRHNLFLTLESEYAIRSEGAFEYQFANDVSWSAGPGIYLLDKDDCSLSFQIMASGDWKDKDRSGTIEGHPLGGKFDVPSTDETSVFLGPQINFTWRDDVTAQFGADVPVAIYTSGVQEIPTFRLYASVMLRF